MGKKVTGDQRIAVCDRWGNPRCLVTLREIGGGAGEAVTVSVGVDNVAPVLIAFSPVPGAPMAVPFPEGCTQRLVYLPNAVDAGAKGAS